MGEFHSQTLASMHQVSTIHWQNQSSSNSSNVDLREWGSEKKLQSIICLIIRLIIKSPKVHNCYKNWTFVNSIFSSFCFSFSIFYRSIECESFFALRVPHFQMPQISDRNSIEIESFENLLGSLYNVNAMVVVKYTHIIYLISRTFQV